MHIKRNQRIAELIKESLSLIIQRDLSDYLPGMVTVMNVEVSDDLKYAKVYVSYFGKEESKVLAMNTLQREVKTLRKKLARVLSIKQLPFLKLIEDSSLDNAFRVESLLTKINADKKSN